MEVQPESRAGASGATASGAEVVARGRLGTRPWDLDRRLRTRHAQRPPLVWVDAAGPCGSWRAGELTQPGDDGGVVAPALIPTQAGDRVTPARRDAVPWARLRRSGALPPGEVPQVADDAIRDLRRARADALRVLKTAPCRLNAVLLRQERRSTGQAPWRPAGPRDRLNPAPVWCRREAQQVCRPWAQAPPRGGVTLDRVKRVTILVPRARPAPDGGPYGGSPPPESRRLTRRLCRAPPLPMAHRKHWAPVMHTSTIGHTP